VGVTANSFSSVSLDPPMVLWSLAHKARSLPAFDSCTHWAVHILGADQEPLSNRFAQSGGDKFAGLDIQPGLEGTPLLPGCAARLQCRTAFKYEGGDHLIFVGEVLEFERTQRPPLLFQSGRYALATRKTASVSLSRAAPMPTDAGWTEDHLGFLLGRAYFQLYGRIRTEARKAGLEDAEYFVLSALLVRSRCAIAQLEALLAHSGLAITPALLQQMQARGLLQVEETDCTITAAGQVLARGIVAGADLIENEAAQALGDWDASSLRNLLKRLIQLTDPGLPDLWA